MIMKKQTLVATLGTLALAANVLLPGLAFGQTDQQTGTLDIECSPSDLGFSGSPTDFNFVNSGGGTLIQQNSAIDAFSHQAGQPLTNGLAATASEHLSVTSPDDFRNPTCGNNGFTLDVRVIDNPGGTDTDGRFFETDSTVDTDPFIPLDTFKVLTQARQNSGASNEIGCFSNFTAQANGICFENTAFCNDGTDTAVACDGSQGTAAEDYASPGLNFNDTETDGTPGTTNYSTSPLGTSAGTDSSSAVEIMSFGNGEELLGQVQFGTAFTVNLPANQASGTYTAFIQYTLVPL